MNNDIDLLFLSALQKEEYNTMLTDETPEQIKEKVAKKRDEIKKRIEQARIAKQRVRPASPLVQKFEGPASSHSSSGLDTATMLKPV